MSERGDHRLAAAGRNALAKIAAVLPEDMKEELDTASLLVGPGEPVIAGDVDLATIRQAIRSERKLILCYRDTEGRETERTVWPFALGFFDRVRVLAAWCELRQDYRHFRADRIAGLTVTDTRYPRRRQVMLKEWRALRDIPEQR